MRSWSYALLGLLLLSAVLSPALGQWNLIAGIRKHVTVSVNYVWAVNNINQVFRCVQPCNGAWIGVPGGLRKQIDAGDEEVWAVNAVNSVSKRPVNGLGVWEPILGQSLKHVSASGNGYVTD